ncbi:MAG TPA: hypothetical protein VLL05_08180 [Terriglobales bacterium]|nr:hypothetical protein [Terriglobales bacterium]
MSETPISPLRTHMIEDMSVRQFGEKTQNDYIRHVRTFSTVLGHSPVRTRLRGTDIHRSLT